MAAVAKQWHLLPHQDDAIRRLAAEIRVPAVVAQLLLNRHVTDPAEALRFLESPLAGLHAPNRLPGMNAAVDRITDAIRNRELIRVFGDYDADGVTGTAILIRLIEQLGGKADFYVPHRLDEGYGLNIEAIQQAKASGVALMITVDCGITAIAEAEEARRIGLDLIVTDHHEMLDAIPNATAVVHPRLPGDYPFGGLSGSGVAFKLAWAVAQRFSASDKVTPELREFLLDAVGLGALGLVADVVPLRDENRICVKHGLKRIAEKPSLGLKALIEVVGLKGAAIKAEDVSFKIAPRLNAAGRLGCAMLVVELLTTKSATRAHDLAECLNGYNQQRQSIERKIGIQAREMIEAEGFANDAALVLGSPEWHQGVIGIVAGRLADQYARPVILLALKANDAASSGSGRSIPGVELHMALRACDEHLLGHGGHAMAAGVKLRPSKLADFRAAFNDYVRQQFPDGTPAPRLVIDAEVPLMALTFGLLKDIDKLEPYGADNPRPKLLATDLTLEGPPKKIGTNEQHLSFRVRQQSIKMRAVAFGMGDRYDELVSAGGICSVVFTPKINEWNGYRSIEMEVIDFRPVRSPDLV